MDRNVDHKAGEVPAESSSAPERDLLWGGNRSLFQLVRKSEKLTAALHVLTEEIPPAEELRTRLRKSSLSLLSCLSVARDISTVAAVREQAAGLIAELLGLVEIAAQIGYFSPMNATVLREEYRALVPLLVDLEARKLFFSPSLGEGFFEVPQVTWPQAVSKGQENDKGHFQSHLKDILKDTSKRAITKSEHRHLAASSLKKHESRREIILRLLKGNRSFTVKDVLASIPDCSEKTLQREFSMLVSEGVLAREGTRRWSVYRRA